MLMNVVSCLWCWGGLLWWMFSVIMFGLRVCLVVFVFRFCVC